MVEQNIVWQKNNMILTDQQRMVLILNTIKQYNKDEDDIGILLVQNVSKMLSNIIDAPITTEDIFYEIEESFDFYNDFIKDKNVDLPLIKEEMKDVVVYYLNIIIKEMR